MNTREVIKYLKEASKVIENYGDKDKNEFNRGVYFTHVGELNRAVELLRIYESELVREMELFGNSEQKEFIGCVCNEEDKHGETSIMCCNRCGKPTEDFWINQ